MVLTALLDEKKGIFLHLIYSITSEGCTAAPSVGPDMRVEPAQWRRRSDLRGPPVRLCPTLTPQPGHPTIALAHITQRELWPSFHHAKIHTVSLSKSPCAPEPSHILLLSYRAVPPLAIALLHLQISV